MLVPGIMGSELRRRLYPDEALWGEDFMANYKRLLTNPGSLVWSGEPASASMLKTVKAGYGPIILRKAHLWQGVLRCLGETAEFADPGRRLEFGYDWRAELADSAARLAASVSARLDAPVNTPPGSNPYRLVLIGHSMGGLVCLVALGTGAIHPAWVDRIVAVGSPLKGAPSAFKGVYGGPALPHFNDLLGLIHGRNRLAFMRNLLACLATFPSVYQLFPHRDIDFLRFEDGRQLNPLRDRAMDAEHRRLAETGHSQVRAGIGAAKANRLKLFSIYADYHEGERTDAYYEVAPMGQRQGYAILEVLDTPSGDGTVLADSAQGKGSFRGFPVRNVSHAFLCNNDKVVDCLRSVL